MKIVIGYFFGVQLLSTLVLAPYITYSKYIPVLESNAFLNPTWFVFFQVWSAFSNTGMR